MANDAQRDKKMTLSIVVLGALSVVGGLYALWGYLIAPPVPVSQVDLNRVGSSAQNKSEETPEYRALLMTSNKEGEARARQENKSFIASIPLEQSVTIPVAQPKSDERRSRQPETPSRPEEGRNNHGESSDKQSEYLKNIVAKIKAGNEHPTGLQMAAVIKADSWQGGRIPPPADDLSRQYTAKSANTVVIPAYYRGAGEISVGIDSDNSSAPVLARFLSGPYAGAILKAPGGAILAGDGVSIQFTEMVLSGTEYKIDAYALDQKTLTASISTDVNNRYFSRIVMPALLKGIGGTGDLYAQANTQVVSNGLNTTTTRPGSPDGKAVTGVIVGGTAGQAAKVLGQDAAKLPVKQVIVTKGQVIAIQFMKGVYTADIADTSRQHSQPENNNPAQAKMVGYGLSESEWRNKAQERINTQQALRNTNRSEYDE
ncbi:conjugal transfer protein TraO [Morganella psychrotolerans]|uniref:conjugal transfer protein TraO n=1 Tax=Morganella psychrotolerans TaxID=368603 RepID=UPI0039AEF9A6